MPEFVIMLFLVGACLGHLTLMIRCHNWVYGSNLPRHTSKIVHFVFASLIVVVPVLIIYWGDWYILDWALPTTSVLHWSWRAYLTAMTFVGFVVLPVVTWQRWIRGEPAVVVETNSTLVDVEAELNERPIDSEEDSWVARFPGNEIFQVDFVEKSLRLERTPPEWNGLKLLHLTDLHFCGSPSQAFFHEVIARCNSWQPDIVALTGDYADSMTHLEWIDPVLSKLQWTTTALAILGNHDLWYAPNELRQSLKALGVRVLGNGCESVDVRGKPMLAIGQEQPWFGPAADMSDAPVGPFRICLSHTPDRIRWAQRHNVDLMLAGHVHGGQIRFPVIGSLLVPSKFGRRFDCGTFHEPPTVLHVGRGLGGEHPIRLMCRPEVTMITLVSK